MKKLIFIICLLSVTSVFAQNTPKKNAADNIFYGGGMGLSIESNYLMFNISPMVGYRFTPAFSGGISVMYAYENYKKRNPDFTVNSFGGGAFLRYDLGPALMEDLPFSIFFQTDYEGRQENIKYKNSTLSDYSEFQNRLYLGAGYYQRLGTRTRAYLMVSVDMLNLNDKVVPLIRAGVEF